MLTHRRALAIVGGIIVACELWAAATRVAHLTRRGIEALSAPGISVQAADLDPLAFYASPQALARAREVIPAHATYSVAVPGKNQGGAILAFRFALLPRVYTPDRRRAQWVIAYEVPSEGVGVRYSREIGLSPEANVVEVKP